MSATQEKAAPPELDTIGKLQEVHRELDRLRAVNKELLEALAFNVSNLGGVYTYLECSPEPHAQHLATVVAEAIESNEAAIAKARGRQL